MAIHLTPEANPTVQEGTLYVDSATGEFNVAGRTTPHIIPGVLYPAYVASGTSPKLLDGTTTHGTGTYNGVSVSTAYGTVQADGRKYYYTNIAGSKPIKDPRIGGHFGSQRHKTKSLQLLEQETATHGLDIYSIDGREWMRGYSNGVDYNDIGNQIKLSAGSNTFFEVTGYFNDINVIMYTSANRGFKYQLNGGSESSEIGSSSVTTPLTGRNVDSGSVLNLGLSENTPKINTVRINYSTGSLLIHAIELIAQDTTSTANRSKIQIPSQNVVSYGKKFNVSGTPHYDPFNGFTSGSSVSSYIDTDTSLGVEKWKHSSTYYRPYNGGRVVKWVDSSGVIKTSVTLMPPNARSIGNSSSLTNANAKANASVANDTFYPTMEAGAIDHSLSEVAKTYLAREFGNGGANGNASYKDATVVNSDDNIAYVLDDGLTSLSAEAVSPYNGTKVGSIGAYNDDYHQYLTFIGTGLSFFGKHTQNNIASNLPYGTHILYINHGSGQNQISIDGVQLYNSSASEIYYSQYDFTFYQPKKPPIPEDAVVLADYMLMADYVKSTNTTQKPDDLSKGIRLQAASRDIFYDRTGGSWDTLGHGSYHGTGFISIPVVAGGNATSLTAKLPYFGFTKGALSVRRATDATDIAVTATNTSGSLESTNVTVTTRVVPALSGNVADASHSSSNVYGFFNWEKSDGVLGNNTVSFDDANLTSTYDWMYISAMEIVSPIHTSSHYQSFETPFLHELVGGDRNMEQTNLVCSPDGKTWDELTRDVSYLGNQVLNSYRSASGSDITSSSTDIWILDEWRGSVNSGNEALFNKDWAIAYDRIICLVDGSYTIHFGNHHSSGAHIYLKINGTIVQTLHHDESGGYGYTASTWTNPFKRGDYVQIQGGYSGTSTTTNTLNLFQIVRDK